jgi:hypothetical protein
VERKVRQLVEFVMLLEQLDGTGRLEVYRAMLARRRGNGCL